MEREEKMKSKHMLVAVLLAFVIFATGGKKEPAPPADSVQTESGGPAAPEATKEASAKAEKGAFTMDIDLEKTVADLKAQAEKMDIESLKAVAVKYKTAIAEKETELKTLMEKLSAIPLQEKMGKEAQALGTDIKNLTD